TPAGVRRRRMRLEPAEFPSFTYGGWSRTNTSGAPQSGRPCRIHSATALPASAGSGSTSGLDVLAWTSRISSRRQPHLVQAQRDAGAAAQPGPDRHGDVGVLPRRAGGPVLAPLKERAGLLAGEARQPPPPPRRGTREQAIDADVAEPGGVEEGEEPPQRPHHVADARRPPGGHLDQ